MAKEPNRTCVICGTKYYACKNCDEAWRTGLVKWRSSCDKPECYQVLLVLTDFHYGKITKEQARSMMSGLLLEVPPPYVPEAQVILDKVLEEDIVEEEPVVEEIQEEHQPEENKPIEEPTLDIVAEPQEATEIQLEEPDVAEIQQEEETEEERDTEVEEDVIVPEEVVEQQEELENEEINDLS